MAIVTKRNVLAAVTATGIVATGVIAVLVGGGQPGGTHFDTSIDASTNTTPPTDWHIKYARTGTICYSQDATATTSKCFASNVLPYTTDATDVGWPVELTQNNRFPTNVSGACGGAPWVCSTATMDSTTADPAGGTTASTITMGGGSLDATAFGYSNSTALDLRMWTKCALGTLDASHISGAGHWTVDCTVVANTWALLHSGHAAVTEVQAWTSDGSGGVRLRLSGTDAAIWHTTATEKASWQNSTIPTTDATGSVVGTAAWTVDNSTGAYWATSGVTKVETLSQYSGTCWNYSGTTISLTGSAGCEATWYALSLTWSY
jgi:hypothetical protein